MCHYYWNRVRRIGVELLREFNCICIEKMLFSTHKICIEIEDYITTVWSPEQNVESINTIYQNSVQSSTYQKWMSNTVKVLRRRMAPPCCGFSVFMGHITEGKLVFTLCVEPYYICTALVNGCYSVCCEKLPQVLELSIHFFFSLFFFFTHPDLIEFIAIDLIV